MMYIMLEKHEHSDRLITTVKFKLGSAKSEFNNVDFFKYYNTITKVV